MNITKKDIETAYRKLKTFIYHDSTLLSVRIKLAEFESAGLKNNLDKFYRRLENEYQGKDSFNITISNISYSLLPKKFLTENNSEKNYTNINQQEKYSIPRLSVFIDCNIEIYLISVLWIMKIGYLLDKKLTGACYANRIDPNDDKKNWNYSSKLFNIYFYKYTEWRDKAIKKAKELHTTSDCILFTLDIKDFFNSIDFNITDIEIQNEYKWLNKLLSKIHGHYSELLSNDFLISKNKHILPIGLMSSYVLANYYFNDFDKYINDKLTPAYYGRYVDDIIIIFLYTEKNFDIKKDYLEQYLFNKALWNSKKVKVDVSVEESNNSLELLKLYEIWIAKNRLVIQAEKVKTFHFGKNSSINLLEEFEKEIKKNSSEFRLEPVEESVVQKFETVSYHITYSDTINKLRSIESFSTNKLGASTHLSKIIEILKYSEIDKKTLTDIFNQISDYFSGVRSLELYSLWEKVLTIYVLSKSERNLVKFARDQIENILKIEIDKNSFPDENLNKKFDINLKNKLLTHLVYCFSMAAALNINFFTTKILNKIVKNLDFDIIDVLLNNFALPTIKNEAGLLVKSNLFRHHYCYYPMLNYCVQSASFSFVNQKIPKRISFKIEKEKLKYSPRFIPLHEFIFFFHLQAWFSNRKHSEFHSDPIQYCIKEFNDFTKYYYNKTYKNNIKLDGRKTSYRKIMLSDHMPTQRIKIGLVNIEIKASDSYDSLKGNPNLSLKRLNEINEVLNFGAQKHCDLIIFPEISVPVQWLDNIMRFSRTNQIGVVCGLEHFKNNKREVFNYIATILPFAKIINNKPLFRNTLLDLRIKKDYSPEELKFIKEKKFKQPKTFQAIERLRLYKWRSAYFSSLNCFELSDLEKRSVFKGKVDFLCVIEYNKDINYFSSIVESIARDIHSYIIQVNSSDFGDSRITLPADTFRRDQAKIKGGKDVTIITGFVDIKALRQFQMSPNKYLKNYQTKQEPIFKHLPANFNMAKERKI